MSAARRRSAAWEGPEGALGTRIRERGRVCLESYRVDPLLVEEHANIELATSEGGYGRRQLYELIQNAADALINDPGGTVQVVLTSGALYCANEGEPIDLDGADALLRSHVSRKRGAEIGRFGLGFKSVLEVTDRPEFYSRTGSFGWDARTAELLIREIVSDVVRTPKLRIAEPLDPVRAAEKDPVLASLMKWATSVVKLPCDPLQSDWLAEDMASFPREFLLFSKHVGKLTLEVRSGTGEATLLPREIRLSAKEGRYLLTEDGVASKWKVYSTVYRPSPSARKDAGEMSNRVEVPIHWAIPLEGRSGPGLLWAFFPTEYETTLSGIVNAPWKTNPDRKNLLDGDFNTELLVEAASLVVDNLEDMLDPEDPGGLLDLMPARGREVRNWADRILTEKVYELAAQVRSLPDQRGELERPARLSLHPDGVPVEILEQWSGLRPPRDWCHPSVETRERRSRAERLIELGGGRKRTLSGWLEALVPKPTLPASRHAILVAAACVAAEVVPRGHIDLARVALTGERELVPLDPDSLFLPSGYGVFGDISLVHPQLARDKELRRAYEVLGIRSVDATAELESKLESDFLWLEDEELEEVWALVRSVGYGPAAQLFRDYAKTPWVRVKSGAFNTLDEALLPGVVVPDDGSRDPDVAVDVDYHENDLRFLVELGAVSAPQAGSGSDDEEWFSGYLAEARAAFLRDLDPRYGNPQRQLLNFTLQPFAGPLGALPHLSDEGKAAFTEALLAAESDLGPWEFGHTTRADAYPEIAYESPTMWMLRRHGRLPTSLGPCLIEDSVGPALRKWSLLLPVAACSEDQADRLGLPDSLASLPADVLEDALEMCKDADETVVAAFYVAAAEAGLEAPWAIVCRLGPGRSLRPPGEVTVVVDENAFEALASVGSPLLRVVSSAAASLLVSRWGLIDAGEEVQTDVSMTPVADPVPLGDMFVPVRHRLTDVQRGLSVVRGTDLTVETVTRAGKTSTPVPFHFDGRTLYWSEDLDDADFLDRVAHQFGLGLDEEEVDAAIRGRSEAGKRQFVSKIRECKTIEERLLAAVGSDAIRAHLPEGLLRVVDADRRRLTGRRLAETALAVYGFDALKEFGRELRERGLNPPDTWSGSAVAVAFAHQLGFPRDYAGFEGVRRPPLLEVDGPVALPELHEFQLRIVGEVRRLVRGEGGWRGLISLPTGAGKTRVAVQALVEAIKDGDVTGPVLWVAQSDELNEQAVQTWSEVWRALGPGDRLSVSRLWSSNEAEPVDRGAHVVVATIDKLQGCVDDSEYSWLAQAVCVVLDEAHHAITREYTRLLEWVGVGRGKGTRPLLGLTATPFRGVSETETRRLVSRFGRRRLDDGAFEGDSYPTLQEMGVLAQVRHQVLPGAELELSTEELRHLKQMHRLPAQVEERLGPDISRNKLLVSEVGKLPESTTALLFATSVEHAQTMAALLSLEGIPAKAVSGGTQPGARRRYVEEFREKKLRVLTNYNVLTQGFDAPAVEAIFVARPTYSPNLYQQMIGRGLRGPANGGTGECLIVNVEDNVLQYGEELAFHQFEHLWKPA